MIHPHVSMEIYRKRVTDRLINNSIELRFGKASNLFKNDIRRHILCADSLRDLKENKYLSDILDISIIYENNTPDKEIINIFSKRYNRAHNSKLLEEVYDKTKLNS